MLAYTLVFILLKALMWSITLRSWEIGIKLAESSFHSYLCFWDKASPAVASHFTPQLLESR